MTLTDRGGTPALVVNAKALKKGRNNMKRIYNDIPLASVMFVIPGYIRITIKDMTWGDLRWNREDAMPVNTWDCMAKESYKMPTKFDHAKIRHIEVPEENHIVFYICTDVEEY